jgi:hypothetical protein
VLEPVVNGCCLAHKVLSMGAPLQSIHAIHPLLLLGCASSPFLPPPLRSKPENYTPDPSFTIYNPLAIKDVAGTAAGARAVFGPGGALAVASGASTTFVLAMPLPPLPAPGAGMSPLVPLRSSGDSCIVRR